MINVSCPKCPNCGAPVSTNAEECTYCGALVVVSSFAGVMRIEMPDLSKYTSAYKSVLFPAPLSCEGEGLGVGLGL